MSLALERHSRLVIAGFGDELPGRLEAADEAVPTGPCVPRRSRHDEQADLVVINGNPADSIGDIRKVETVFKQGIGYDPAKLIASVQGKAGIW